MPTDENPNPETLKVVSIQDYAFLNCTKLVSVSIPNTVRTISLTAFDGCRYIERYEVREIEGEIDPVYFAQEGTLLYRNIVMQGEVEIALVPATFTEARQIATGRMVKDAESLGADAIVGMRYASASVMQGAAEVIAYGTAVKFV